MRNVISIIVLVILQVFYVNAFADGNTRDNTVLTSQELEIILNLKDNNGRTVRDFSEADEIYKSYYVDYACDCEFLFENYDGDFKGCINQFLDDTDEKFASYVVVIPEIRNGNLVNEFWINGHVTKDSKLFSVNCQIQNNIGKNTIYPINEIGEKFGIGNVESVVHIQTFRGCVMTGIYVETDTGKYVIPIRSNIGKVYNRYNEIKMDFENLNAYTTYEFVDAFKKEVATREIDFRRGRR